MTEKEFYEAELADIKRWQNTKKIIMGVLLTLVFLGVIIWFEPWKSVSNENVLSLQGIDNFGFGGAIFFGIVAIICFMLPEKQDRSALASTKVGERISIFIVFHLIVGLGLWEWAQYFVYPSLGEEGFWKSTLDLIGILLIAKSVWDSFDTDTIKLNFRGEILYFNRSFASNVEPGFVCLGLPKWFATTIKTVDFTSLNITLGVVKNGVREPLILECRKFRTLVNGSFEAEPFDTARILKLGGGAAKIEERLRAEVKSAIYAELNKLKIDEYGKEIPVYPNIDDVKFALWAVQRNLISDTMETGINVRFDVLGYKLTSITIEGFENEDRQIISAQQALVAKRLLEDAEFINIQSKIAKVDLMFKAMNGIGTDNDLTGEKMFTREQALGVVERDEGVIKKIVIEGGGNSILMSDLFR